MSRAASKNRADKGRGLATPAPLPPAQTQDIVDIIPGRLTQSFWMTMIGQEEGEEVVRDILDDLMTHVMEKCKDVYLKRQLIPYTVSRARDTLLEILEWRFLVQDPGELSDSTWKEDVEPLPLLTDSWSQGCVTVTQRKPTPPKQPRTSQHGRRRSHNSTSSSESHQRPSEAGKRQKDPKVDAEAKSRPALTFKSQAERKLLPPYSVISDPSLKNNLGSGSPFQTSQKSGIPQKARRNTHIITSSMPQSQHTDSTARAEWRSMDYLALTSAL